MISEELSTEELDKLEKQRYQLEEEIEAQQQPSAPLTMKQLTVKILQCFYVKLSDAMNYLEEVDPDVEQAGLARLKVLSDLALYDRMLYDKRREASQANLDAFFSKVSLPEASASDKPPTSEEPTTSDETPASYEPQPSTSTGSSTHRSLRQIAAKSFFTAPRLSTQVRMCTSSCLELAHFFVNQVSIG